MKTSEKILLAVAGFVIVYLVTGLVALRNETLQMLSNAKLENKYKAMPVDNFEGLDFSAHWIVSIKQGNEYKVELAGEEDTPLKPKLENIDGTLYFKVDIANEKEYTGSIHANVTAPSLREIKAVGGSKIHLENFDSDSLSILLEDSVAFTGEENEIRHLSFKISGDAWLEFIDEPLK